LTFLIVNHFECPPWEPSRSFPEDPEVFESGD